MWSINLLLIVASLLLRTAVEASVAQQNPELNPPFPILEVGRDHVLSQIGTKATKAENDSIASGSTSQHSTAHPQFLALGDRDAPAACGPNLPCRDKSCCNSEGKCGFLPYNCETTGEVTCISNCNARANCGTLSLSGEQKCPLNTCCSYFGYCGTSEIFCDTSADNPTPCQQGFGSCELINDPYCDKGGNSASAGRKVAYYQLSNVYHRSCQRISPAQINTTGLTHLILAFAEIDPKTFDVVPSDILDYVYYPEFTALKTPKMETWIGLGGGSFSDPGPTHTTFSDIASSPSNRASFIASLIQFMDRWGFQGVELDWEYPSIPYKGGKPEDAANLVTLVCEMKKAFGRKYGLSSVLPPDFTNLAGNDPVGMSPCVDFFNFMAYDLHGPWEEPWLGAFVRPQTSILDIDTVLRPLWYDGVPPSKVNLGIAYYARGFTLANTSCAEIGCPHIGGNKGGPCAHDIGILTLQEIKTIIKQKNLTPKLLPELMILELTWDDQWIGYDDDITIAMKTKWADEHCLGGTVAWSIDLNSGSGSGDAPLIASTNGACGDGTDQVCLDSKFGNCCSKDGLCGKTDDFCLPEEGCQLEYGICVQQNAAGIRASVDGTCGNKSTCVGSGFGICCSSEGKCGSSGEYCSPGKGCQPTFGVCYDHPETDLFTSVDGTCGGNTTCIGSAFGECCSQYSYCGTGAEWCDSALDCQPLFGICQ